MTLNTTTITDKILTTVKKINGIGDTNTDFDTDMVFAINTVLANLNQLGIGEEDFRITGNTETWGDLLDDEEDKLSNVVSWVSLKVKMLFDPPASSTIKQTYDELLKELEWRIYVTKNYVNPVVTENTEQQTENTNTQN